MARAMGITRRDAIRALVAGSVGAVAGGAAYGYFYERTALAIERAELAISGLPASFDRLRIAFITDLHHSDYLPQEAVARAAAMAMRERPDLIVLGGDYISFFERRFIAPCAEALATLSAPLGVYGILGNHDDEREVTSALRRRGFEMLNDARTTITRAGESIELAGIRFWTRRASDIARIVRGATSPILLLAHDPRRLVEAAALDIGGVLSGHTHGGQVVIPGIGALAARRFPVVAGLARRENTSIFVSRGVGTVLVPVRLNCPPEVAIVTLRRQSEL
jgi:uncharacterized protein